MKRCHAPTVYQTADFHYRIIRKERNCPPVRHIYHHFLVRIIMYCVHKVHGNLRVPASASFGQYFRLGHLFRIPIGVINFFFQLHYLFAAGIAAVRNFLYFFIGLVVPLQIWAGKDSQQLYQIQVHTVIFPGNGFKLLIRHCPSVYGNIAHKIQAVQSGKIVLNPVIGNPQRILGPHLRENSP